MYGKGKYYYISADFAKTAYYAEFDGSVQLKNKAKPISWAAHVNSMLR